MIQFARKWKKNAFFIFFFFFEVVQYWDKSLIFFLIHYQWFSKLFFCSKVQSNVDTFWLDSFRAKIPSELGQEAASRSSHGANYSKIGGSLKLARATFCNFTRKKSWPVGLRNFASVFHVLHTKLGKAKYKRCFVKYM